MHVLDLLSKENHCTSAVIVRNGNILLGLRHYRKSNGTILSVWTTPGGRCEKGETIEQCLRRETQEETGIANLEIRAFMRIAPAVFTPDLVYTFFCETEEEPTLMEPDKFSEWKWFPLHEIPKNFINPTILQLINDQFSPKSKKGG
jgi:8-oxo-dGTP diphosphatase